MSSAEDIARYMDRVPGGYPPEQRAYFLALYDQFVRTSAMSGSINLNNPCYRFFTDLDPATRAEYVFDLNSIGNVLRLREQAKTLGVVTLEMNGGLGTSLGLDPAERLSKATGVRFEASVEDGETVSLSILEAKFLWMIR